MTWNYRILRTRTEYGSYEYSVIEVYYDSDEIQGWCEAGSVFGESLSELEIQLVNMKAAAYRPTLEEVFVGGWKELVEVSL